MQNEAFSSGGKSTARSNGANYLNIIIFLSRKVIPSHPDHFEHGVARGKSAILLNRPQTTKADLFRSAFVE
jgi:hypothetical protein